MAVKEIIQLPHRIQLRPYQLDVFKNFNKFNRFINVWHRRAGKDKCWFNIMIRASLERKANYVYCLPEIKHAKKVIWESIDSRGLKFIDHIPPALLDGDPNNSDLIIKLINGSTIQLLGADNYNSIVGSNPFGIVFSEYSLCHPLAWQYLQPILIENNGWAAFIFTPRGENHAYKLYNENKDSPGWYSNLLTVNDTYDNNGKLCVSKENIDKARKSGFDEQLIKQEFFCSFSASLVGAYYAEQIDALQAKGRIAEIEIDPMYPISTYWDLGIDGATAIWFTQRLPNGAYNIINYYENTHQRIDHYVNFIKNFQHENGVTYKCHYLPHDARNTTVQTGKSTADIVENLGLPVKVLDRPKSILDGIELTKFILPKCFFNKTLCSIGLNSLKSYCAKWDSVNKTYKGPTDNWASHGSDAFRYFATTETDLKPEEVQDTIINISMNEDVFFDT